MLIFIAVLVITALFSNQPSEVSEQFDTPSPSPTTALNSPSPLPSLTPEETRIASQDPQDRDPVLRSQAEAEINSKPAFQKLPYEKDGVSIYHVDATADNKAVLEVVYSGSRTQAEAVYEVFLRENNDPGTAYKVVYNGGDY